MLETVNSSTLGDDLSVGRLNLKKAFAFASYSVSVDKTKIVWNAIVKNPKTKVARREFIVKMFLKIPILFVYINSENVVN